MVNPIKQESPDYYLFIIDTNKYAGNFEREMCAYITGQIGECEVGDEQAELAKKEIPEEVAQLEELVESIPDEHGCARPVAIFPNPRYGNNGYGGQKLLNDKNQEQFPFPAYNSIAIYFNSIPNSKLLDIMKKRAKEIGAKGIGTKKFEEQIEIEGFRLLEKRTTYKGLNL
jgi:hypothetical protein